MKPVDYKKPVNTIPDGVWESSRPENGHGKNQQSTTTTDLQGNGYPAGSQKNKHYAVNKQDMS